MPRVLKYLVDSRTPTDMVVLIHTGSYTGPGYVDIVVPHGLPFVPLPFGIYSIDDGVTWNSLEVTNGNAFGSTIIADATNITIGIRVEQSTTTTFLIKLFAFAPSVCIRLFSRLFRCQSISSTLVKPTTSYCMPVHSNHRHQVRRKPSSSMT